MSWHDHVATIAQTASQKLGVLFRCRKLYTPEQLLLLYKAQIRPSLEYCSHVWGCAPKHSLKLLDSIQNRAVKLIDTDNLTKDLHSLEHRRRVAGLSLFYRFYHGRCSSELSQIITPKAVRTRNSRDALHAHPYQVEVPTPRTSLLQHSFFWKTSTLWNELPGSLFPDGYDLRFKTNHNGSDGCLAHCAVPVRENLNNTIPNSWIEGLSPITWPPGSPNLTPLHFHVWGRIKELVYQVEINDTWFKELMRPLYNDKISDFENKLVKIDEYVRKTDKLMNEHGKLKADVQNLNERLNDMEQTSLLNNIEIQGIPERANENVVDIHT
nr:unnamed protein product [Callosobruchus analis]